MAVIDAGSFADSGVTKRPRAGIKVSTCELEVVNICANFQIHWDGQEI